uniref:Uncharacterized protein LOC100178956 n=1 Tax=Phallusia mammillata TaxID=59560 RepID=A0A6F9DG92_9ASCI|nr:uncharacterized protein LOC100178956 [Phallusia mammillata]
MDFKETMSQANIASLQTWLASELELHKIDAVIFTHHVLDIFLNSRHTDDLHLAEKEESIFAKLPGAKNRKPKHKYNKRTNSFTAGDELSLKKEMAIKCLLSAVDKNNDDVLNDEAIKKLIENLCSRINEVNILSENKGGSSSDEEHANKKQRSTSLPNTQREKYQDAFPSLFAASGGATTSVSGVSETVWGGTAKTLFTGKIQNTKKDDTEQKTGCNPATIPQPQATNSRMRMSRQRRRNKPAVVSEDSCTSAKRTQGNKSQTNKFLQKPACHHRQQNINSSDYKSSHNHTWKHQHKFDRRNKTTGRKSSSKTQKSTQQASKPVDVMRNTAGLWNPGAKQQHHWHDSAPAASAFTGNLFHGGYGFGATECWQLPLEQDIPSPEECEQPKLQSKWFRDPQSGFLEFEPGKKSPQNKSPHAGGSSDEAVSDEDRESASESWLWCPSPSLWDDNQASSPSVAVSRLETMYRPPDLDASPSDEAGQLWEDYKAIFTEVENDLQKCQDDSDESDGLYENLPQQIESILNSIWAEENYFPLEFGDNQEPADENGNYLHKDGNHGNKECTASLCLYCSTFKRSWDSDEVNLCLLDSSISDNLALLHKQIDLISEDLNLLSRKADDELSRKRIWLRNSQDIDYGSPTKFFCGMKQNRVYSGLPDWGEEKKGMFGNFCDKSYLMDDFFTDVTSTLFASDLQWLGCGNLDPIPDIKQLLQLQASCDVTSKDEDDDACYVAGLVRSVIEFVTDTDEQNPLMLQVDMATDDHDKDDDFLVPHPEDQASTFPHDSRNFQENSKGLADCVTENEAWKTSLRIGNMWQAIAGIRPVDIVYSEKQNPSDPCILQPSAMTHFRPIHHNEVLESENSLANPVDTNKSLYNDGSFGSYTSSFVSSLSPTKHLSTSLYSDSVESQLKGIEKEIGKLLFENPSCDENSPNFEKFCPKFHKQGLDKCQQTGTFEQHIQLMDTDLEKELTGRPPKANSR